MKSGVPEILQSLRCDRRANDRRRHPRVGLRARVSLATLSRCDEPQRAWMRDLSEGGAGLLVSEELKPDQAILLDVPVTSTHTVAVRCRVVHCEKFGGFWRAGVEFINKPWRDTKNTVIGSTLPASPGPECGISAEMRRIQMAILD